MSDKRVPQKASFGQWSVFAGVPLAVIAVAVLVQKMVVARMPDMAMDGAPHFGNVLLVAVGLFAVLFVSGMFVMSKMMCCSCGDHAGGGLPFGKPLGTALRAAATTLEQLSNGLRDVDALAEGVADNINVSIPALQFVRKELNTVPLPGASLLPNGLFVITVDTSASTKPLDGAATVLRNGLDAPTQATADTAYLLRQAAAVVEG